MSSRSLIFRQRLWRWHFIAGLVVCPFAILLSITGAIYLFKPQIENYEETSINALASIVEQGTQAITLDTQIKTLLAENPGADFKALTLAKPGDRSIEIELQNSQGEKTVFWIDTITGEQLAAKASDQRFMARVKKLHSELLLGSTGSYVVELMASWLIILVISGLYLWLSKSQSKNSESLVTKVEAKKQVKKWRSRHSVVGVWFTLPIIILLISGLPWTQLWGAGFDRFKEFSGITGPGQEWFVTLTSNTPEHKSVEIPQSNLWQVSDVHQGHHGSAPTSDLSKLNLTILNNIRDKAEVRGLVHPIQIAPPKPNNGVWTVRSLTAQRSQRETIHFDQHSGEQIMRIGFEDHHPLERFVSQGVSLHEGALFGWLNQLLGLLTALGVICISGFGLFAWWLRKPKAAIDEPTHEDRTPSARLFVGILLLGLLLPAAGVSFVVIFLFEWVAGKITSN